MFDGAHERADRRVLRGARRLRRRARARRGRGQARRRHPASRRAARAAIGRAGGDARLGSRSRRSSRTPSTRSRRRCSARRTSSGSSAGSTSSSSGCDGRAAPATARVPEARAAAVAQRVVRCTARLGVGAVSRCCFTARTPTITSKRRSCAASSSGAGPTRRARRGTPQRSGRSRTSGPRRCPRRTPPPRAASPSVRCSATTRRTPRPRAARSS